MNTLNKSQKEKDEMEAKARAKAIEERQSLDRSNMIGAIDDGRTQAPGLSGEHQAQYNEFLERQDNRQEPKSELRSRLDGIKESKEMEASQSASQAASQTPLDQAKADPTQATPVEPKPEKAADKVATTDASAAKSADTARTAEPTMEQKQSLISRMKTARAENEAKLASGTVEKSPGQKQFETKLHTERNANAERNVAQHGKPEVQAQMKNSADQAQKLSGKLEQKVEQRLALEKQNAQTQTKTASAVDEPKMSTT